MSETKIHFHAVVFADVALADVTHDPDFHILIKTPAETLTERQAIEICHMTCPGVVPRDLNGIEVRVTHNCAAHGHAAKRLDRLDAILDFLPDGTPFYRAPGPTLPIDLILSTHEPGANTTPVRYHMSAPAFLVTRDPTGDAVRGLLKQIVDDYRTANQSANLDGRNVLETIPPEFLRRYGVVIRSDEVFLTLTMCTDELLPELATTKGD